MTRKRISSASFTPGQIESMYDVIRNARDASKHYTERNELHEILLKLKPLRSPDFVALIEDMEKKYHAAKQKANM